MPNIGDTITPAHLDTAEKSVVRRYLVALMPDANPDNAYEPIEVTLAYTPAEAKLIDPRSKRAVNEAFKRAIKVEQREHETPAGRAFFNGGVEFLREHGAKGRKG